MIVRVLVLAAAIAAIVYGAVSLHRDDACSSAVDRAFAVTLGAPAAGLRSTAHEIEAECRGATQLVVAVSALLHAGDRRGALTLARTAVAREPENFLTWVGLWQAQRGSDPAAAARARARAHELNPRYAAAS